MDNSDRVDRPTDDVREEEVGRVANAGGTAPGTEATSSGMGTLAGGLVGAIAARDIVDEEVPPEERPALDANRPDLFGETYTETGDQGVSRSQKELEANELNG